MDTLKTMEAIAQQQQQKKNPLHDNMFKWMNKGTRIASDTSLLSACAMYEHTMRMMNDHVAIVKLTGNFCIIQYTYTHSVIL